MARQSWQVSLTVLNAKPLTEKDLDKLLDEFDPHAGVLAMTPGDSECKVVTAIDAPDCGSAVAIGIGLVLTSPTFTDPVFLEIHAIEWNRMEKRLDENGHRGKVVGYAEIAKIAGVSRQGARGFLNAKNFPQPVIETARGPLFDENAVIAWNKAREHRLRGK